MGLQDQTLLASLFLALLGQQSRTCCVFEHLSDAFVGLCRAFEVVLGADLLLDLFALGFAFMSEMLFYDNALGKPLRGNAMMQAAAESIMQERDMVIGFKKLPVLVSLASEMSYVAPRWSSGRSANPSCSRPG